MKSKKPLINKVLYAFLFLSVFFLSSYSNATSIQDNSLGNILIDAADRGDSNQVTELFKKGHIVDQQGFLNITPLMRACYRGHTDVVRLLLSFNASIEMQDEGGATALHYAVRGGNLDIVELLIASGASLNVKDKLGYTPLERARSAKNKNILIVMEDLEASNMKNSAAGTLNDIAHPKNYPASEGMPLVKINKVETETTLTAKESEGVKEISVKQSKLVEENDIDTTGAIRVLPGSVDEELNIEEPLYKETNYTHENEIDKYEVDKYEIDNSNSNSNFDTSDITADTSDFHVIPATP